jgi:hypothetical protein
MLQFWHANITLIMFAGRISHQDFWLVKYHKWHVLVLLCTSCFPKSLTGSHHRNLPVNCHMTRFFGRNLLTPNFLPLKYHTVKKAIFSGLCSESFFWRHMTSPPKNTPHQTTSKMAETLQYYGSLPHDGFWPLLGQKSCYEKCDQTKICARTPHAI